MRLRPVALLLPPVALLWIGTACESEPQPCDRYVDYMCSCHGDDTGVDCDELDNTYSGADADVQDQCELQLQDQKDVDSDAGDECPA